ncbi:MAG: hypothetical protein CSYNP_00002 [Syntrophus sp. SKADARSKE-3]|nr:hypothetical protein [Syntrophus sp. SKADARSKE-3]
MLLFGPMETLLDIKEVYPESPQGPSPLKVKEVWADDRRYIVCLNESRPGKMNWIGYSGDSISNYERSSSVPDFRLKKERDTMPVEGPINIGTANKRVDPNRFLGEGGPISRLANKFPGVNCSSGHHDVFQVKIDEFFGFGITGERMRNIFNIPGMVPAVAIGYDALMTDANTLWLYSNSKYFE